MNRLIELDQALLVAINNWNCPFMDQVMWYISTKWLWIPLYLVLAGLLFWRFGWKKALLCLLAFALAVGLSDFISSGLIKPWVARWRPTREPALEGLVHIVNGYIGGKYGFPSSHAANSMAVAVLFSLIWTRSKDHKNKSHQVWWLLISWSLLVSYSRMYLGVHYPLDILCGLILGAVLAVGVWLLLDRVDACCTKADNLRRERDRTSVADVDETDQSACP